MPLQTSGEINSLQIANEFGQAHANFNLFDYYRDGGIVPDSPANAGIPTAGEIDYRDFYGASNVTTTIITVTEGQTTFPIIINGFSSRALAFGSVNNNMLAGIQIMELSVTPSPAGIAVYLSGNVPQDHFTSVQFQDGTVLTSASAGYGYNAAGDNTTSWSWAITPPARWDGAGTSTVTFISP